MADWYAGADFAVHADIKRHTENLLTTGKGATQNNSMKQKVSTKSSTEAELVAENGVLSHLLWTRNLIQQKGYNCDSKFHQYNTSEILLETNRL